MLIALTSGRNTNPWSRLIKSGIFKENSFESPTLSCVLDSFINPVFSPGSNQLLGADP